MRSPIRKSIASPKRNDNQVKLIVPRTTSQSLSYNPSPEDLTLVENLQMYFNQINNKSEKIIKENETISGVQNNFKKKLLQALEFTRSCYYNEPVDAETFNQGNEAYSCLKESIEETDNLREFVKFIAKNCRIFTDKLGYNLGFKWLSINVYIPNNKRDLIRNMVEKYGEQN